MYAANFEHRARSLPLALLRFPSVSHGSIRSRPPQYRMVQSKRTELRPPRMPHAIAIIDECMSHTLDAMQTVINSGRGWHSPFGLF